MVEKFADYDYIISQVQFIKLGNLAIVSIPGEPFSNPVLKIKAGSKYLYTAIVSYGNDHIRYFPDVNSFKKQTYESLTSPFNNNTVEKLYKIVSKLLQKE